MKPINIALITLIIVLALFVLFEKYRALDRLKGFIYGYICHTNIVNTKEVNTKEINKRKKIENMTIIDKIVDETSKLYTQLTEKKEQFNDGIPDKDKTLLLSKNRDETDTDKYFTLEQIQKDEDKVTKYIREIALGARYAEPNKEFDIIPKEEYVKNWMTMDKKINKYSHDYENAVDRVNKIYLTNNNEMAAFTNYSIKDVYDNITRTNKPEFEKAFANGEMATYKSNQWYYDPKLYKKVGAMV